MDENIRKDWQEARFNCPDEIPDNYINGRRRTGLQNLMRRYRWFSNMALIMMIWLPVTAVSTGFGGMLDEKARIWFAIYGAVYFLICSVMDRWLYMGIRSIDCARMSVSEVSRLALFYRRRHLQFIVVLLPLALIYIGGLVWKAVGDDYSLVAAVVGAVVGLAIGTNLLFRFLADYRDVAD